MEKLLLIFILGTVFFVCLAFVVTLVLKNTLPIEARVPVFTVIFTLLLTPSFIPTHMFAIPIPFSAVLVSMIGGETSVSDFFDLFIETLWWHIPAISVTGFVSFKLASEYVGT